MHCLLLSKLIGETNFCLMERAMRKLHCMSVEITEEAYFRIAGKASLRDNAQKNMKKKTNGILMFAQHNFRP